MKHFNKTFRSMMRRNRSSRAQAMVEFALVLPLLLLLLVAIIDLGRALFVYSQVSNATREAARYSANTDVINPTTHRLDCASIESHARGMFSIMPNTLNVTVEIERPSGGTFTYIPCTDATNNGQVQNGDRVRVQTVATVDMLTLQFIAPLAGGRIPGTWPIEFTSSRTLLPVKGIATGPTTTPLPFGSGGGLDHWHETETKVAELATATSVAATATSVAATDVVATGTSAAATAISVAATQTAQAVLGTLTTPTHTPTPTPITPTPTPGTPTPTATSTTPGAATNFAVASVKCNGQFDIVFTWTAPVGGGTVAWYRIFDSVSGAQIGSDILAPATTYTVKDAITNNQSRTFRIVAYSSAGVPGSPSNTAAATCGDAPTNTPTPIISLTPTLTPTPGTQTPTVSPTPTATACPVVWATNYPSVKTGKVDTVFMKAQIFCGATPITNAVVYPVSNGGTVYTTTQLVPLTSAGYYGTAPDTCHTLDLAMPAGFQLGLEASYTWNGVPYVVTAVPVDLTVQTANGCP